VNWMSSGGKVMICRQRISDGNVRQRAGTQAVPGN
jgi:hypothetical protein